MRVTNQGLLNSIVQGLQRNISRLDEQQSRIAAGKRVLTPSDDPAATVKILELRAQMAQAQQYATNAQGGIELLDQSDSTMQQMEATFHRVRELATGSATATNSASSYQANAAELDQIIRGLADLANTEVGGQYLFSGWAIDKPPVSLVTDPATGLVTSVNYLATTDPANGIDGVIKREIAPGVQVPINVTVQGLFTKGVDPATGSTIDLLNSLVAVRGNLTALSVDPHDAVAQQAVGDSLAGLSTAEDALLAVHTDVGSRVKRLEAAIARADGLSDGLTRVISGQEDLDVTRAILELAQADSSYKLSLQMGARIVQPTLLDFLR